MKLLNQTDVQRLAAAKALEWSEGKGAVASVSVNGAAVALNDAKQTLETVQRELVAPEPGFVDRWADKLDARVQGFGEKLASKPLGKKALDVLLTDAERVAQKVAVDVAFADGHSEKVTVEVVDVQASALLNRLSLAAEIGSLTPVPLVGEAVSALAALLASGGAKVSEWAGHPELAEALKRAALKQWVLMGVGFVPGIGTASTLIAATHDLKDRRSLYAGPPVSVIAEPA